MSYNGEAWYLKRSACSQVRQLISTKIFLPSGSLGRLSVANRKSNPVYRLNTYPLIHTSLLSAFFSALALTPLMERFEADHGTLLIGAMFVGRMLVIKKLLRKNPFLIIDQLYQPYQRLRISWLSEAS